MAARNTRGIVVRMSTAASVAGELAVTDVSEGAPAVVTVDDATGIQENDLITIPAGATGMTELDGKSWVAVNVDTTANTFELLGSDTTGQPYVPGADPSFDHTDAAGFVVLCLSGLSPNAGTASTTSVATYCDPTATLANPVVEAGSYDFTGYIDTTDPGFRELTEAYDDGNLRHFEIIMPGGNGVLVFDGTVSALNYDLPVDGALGYNGTITLSGRPRHLFE